MRFCSRRYIILYERFKTTSGLKKQLRVINKYIRLYIVSYEIYGENYPRYTLYYYILFIDDIRGTPRGCFTSKSKCINHVQVLRGVFIARRNPFISRAARNRRRRRIRKISIVRRTRALNEYFYGLSFV